MCCSPWGGKESEWLSDWTELNLVSVSVSLMTQRTQGICWRIYLPHPQANTEVRNNSRLLLLLSQFSRVRLCAAPQMAAHQALPSPDSPGKNTGVGCHFLLQCIKVKSESKVAQSCPTLATPWTAARQDPPFMGFSRQEYWSGMPLPSPRNNSLGNLNQPTMYEFI